ncbi:ZIP family metal transporter [Legionella oakridgensis]|uniref:Zinc transporter ZupT n=2 Tax=Legionella oakridgensis TaxID=29423 RepID=A0A0W0WY52_9GAMM|nr:ZIP family metal transporter [Legionella oakridgensis]AHE66298.1 putative divalent heavy-metal cations transporter [Legionella oakridgensis ATCC 33761 = DSM 21215]KTD37237.1 Zinc transporter ZupT [Legionella oakridgensis]STY16189.1 Zinc transporter ZupT [Legionella longbeachae]
MQDFILVISIAIAAAIASPVGGLIAIWKKPTTFFMSLALGFASGVLLATASFEMLPQAQELSSLSITVIGFAVGFILVYAFDLFIHRGKLAGEESEQYLKVRQFYQRHHIKQGEVTVLAGGTSIEELIEGISIGVGAAIKPGLGLLIGLAIIVDNLSEGLSVGELIRAEQHSKNYNYKQRILAWTSLIGGALLVSSLLGWYFLRGLPSSILGFLIAIAGGGLFYLTITKLVPEAEERHYQQSAALAMAIGFLFIFTLSKFF